MQLLLDENVTQTFKLILRGAFTHSYPSIGHELQTLNSLAPQLFQNLLADYRTNEDDFSVAASILADCSHLNPLCHVPISASEQLKELNFPIKLPALNSHAIMQLQTTYGQHLNEIISGLMYISTATSGSIIMTNSHFFQCK